MLIFNPKAPKGQRVRFFKDWNANAIGQLHQRRINHVSPDQVWIQTLAFEGRLTSEAFARKGARD